MEKSKPCLGLISPEQLKPEEEDTFDDLHPFAGGKETVVIENNKKTVYLEKADGRVLKKVYNLKKEEG